MGWYVLVIGVVGAATALRWALNRLLGGGMVFITYYPAIAAAALVGRARAGLVATVLSAVAVNLFFQEPRGSLKLESVGDWVALGLFGIAGGLMSWMAELVDRAHRREAEAAGLARGAEALRQSEERFKKAFRSSPVALVISRLGDGKIMEVNETFAKLVGHDRAGLIGRRSVEVGMIGLEERAALIQALGEGGKLEQKEMALRSRDGEVHWVLASAERMEVDGEPCIIWTGFDVTDRKQAEAALKESHRRTTETLESISDAFFSLDEHLVVTYYNRAAEEILNRKREVVLGRNLFDAFPEARGSIFEAKYTESLREKKPQAFESYFGVAPFANWYDVRVYPQAEGISVYFRLTTERKRAEETLRESEERWRTMVECDPHCVKLLDREGRVLEMNGAGLGLMQVTLQEVRGQEVARLVAEEDQGAFREMVAGVFRGESRHLIFDMVGAKGRRLTLETVSVPLWESPAKRRVKFLLGLTNDITERKRAEEALQREEERLRLAKTAARLGIYDHNLVTGWVGWDERMRELWGVGPDTPITYELFMAGVVPEDRVATQAAIARAMDPAGDGGYYVEYRVRNALNNQTRWVGATGRVNFVGGRAVRRVGTVQDITERKEFQAELERLVADRTARLQEMVGELEHFSYTITHDLKSPLRAMRGFAEIASLMCGDGVPQEAKAALGKIATSAERMDGLIADALSYSRAVRQELPLTNVDSGALLRGMLDSYPELQPSRAQIRVEGKLPVVLGNEAGLTQCFSNLLGNAVKFVRPGEKPEIRVWGEVLADGPRGGWARIWVEDKGIGISKEMVPRVFEMFSRGSRDYEGTGIGLALVRKVTERMGGRAGVESEEGTGSRFWVELKVGEVRAKAGRVEVAPAEPEGGTVLYVEDEEGDAMFMQRAFAGRGMESALRVVGDGRAAIEYLSGAGKYADRREYPLPSVVLLDLNLPQVTGFEVLKWMRNNPDYARTPVVVFSSSTREDDRVKALELGANEFVGKPNSGLEFGEVVDGLRQRWMERGGAGGGRAADRTRARS